MELILESPAMMWLGLLILLLVIEIVTLQLTTIWFAGGALAAFAAAVLGADTTVQWAVFLILSFSLLVLTRPAAMKYMSKGHVRTNADSLIGKTAVVSKEINNLAQTGEVMIADVSWTARTKEDGCVVPGGGKVKICAIEGVKLIVEEVKEEK